MSEEISTNVNIDASSLDKKSEEVAVQILNTEALDEAKDLTAIFNLNTQKRNVLRVLKMNSLLDKVTDQMVERFEKYPNNFTNDDLLRYMQVAENSIEKANQQLRMVKETPAIQLIQNNQINLNTSVSALDRESRQKVTETVQAILKNMHNETNKDTSVIDVTPKDVE